MFAPLEERSTDAQRLAEAHDGTEQRMIVRWCLRHFLASMSDRNCVDVDAGGGAGRAQSTDGWAAF